VKRSWPIESFLLISVSSALASQSVAQSPAPQQEQLPKSSLPAKLAEDAVVNLFGSLFIFDHLFMKSATATSPGYLERVSEPASKLYPDYLAYKSGKIDQAELVRRLPHIAMIGDSLSKNFYISSPASILWRARTERQRDWFLDTDPSPQSVYSLYERLEQVTPVVATEYSTSGALVTPSRTTEQFSRHLARTHNLPGQITRLTRAKRFPDVILLWIGHNNTDWVKGFSETERKKPAKRLRQIARQFGADYAAGLRVLLDHAEAQNHRVAIVVFGLADFKTFFEARKKAAALHAGDPALYPYYDATCRYFEALKPENQEGTIQLGLMLNNELKKVVVRQNRILKRDSNVRLDYSDAFSMIDLSDLRGLHRMDAWHPSILGHDFLAYKAFKAIGPSLDFVGVDRRSQLSVDDQSDWHKTLENTFRIQETAEKLRRQNGR
jgi:hypothetical protein